MTIGYPPVQSQRPNDDERTVYLGSKNVGPTAERHIPTPSQGSYQQTQQPYPQAPQAYPPANPQNAPQQPAAGYGHYGWGNQAAPASQPGGGSKVAIIAIAAVVAVISVSTLGFALTRPNKHAVQAKAETTSQSGDQSGDQSPEKSAGKPSEPSPAPAPAAPTVAPSTLKGLLMSLPESAAVLGTGAMVGSEGFGDTIYTISKSTIVDQDCISVLPAQLATYQGSGYSDVRQQFLSSSNNDVKLTQSVSTFTNPAAALHFVTATKAKWEKCAGRNINFRSADDPAGPNTFFVFGAVSQTDDVVNIPSTQEGHGDWTCQNGLTARSNVVIDLVVCGNGMQGSVARGATDKIGAKVTAAAQK